MIRVSSGKKVNCTTCKSCGSNDDISEYFIGSEFGAIVFSLCKSCKKELRDHLKPSPPKG